MPVRNKRTTSTEQLNVVTAEEAPPNPAPPNAEPPLPALPQTTSAALPIILEIMPKYESIPTDEVQACRFVKLISCESYRHST